MPGATPTRGVPMGTLGSVIALTPQPLALAVSPPLDAITSAVQAPVDPISPALEALGQTIPARGRGATRLLIQTLMDAVAAPIEPLFDPITLAVESFLDALPRTLGVVLGMGGSHSHTEQHA